MASFLSISSLLVFALVIQSYTSVHSSPTFSSKLDTPVLNDICSRTKNPSYCLDVLKSSSKTATADLPGLCQIAIDLTHSNVASTYKDLPSLISKTTNPKIYTSCDDGYAGAIDRLDDATMHLKSGDSMGVNMAASSAMDYVGDCEDSFASPSDVPSKLAVDIKNFDVLCEIIMVVSNLLPQ